MPKIEPHASTVVLVAANVNIQPTAMPSLGHPSKTNKKERLNGGRFNLTKNIAYKAPQKESNPVIRCDSQGYEIVN